MVVISTPRKIGDINTDENREIQCDFVEVDESQICNRKYNRGDYIIQNLRGYGLWGEFAEEQAFMVRAPNRRINVINYLLQTRIELGSILVTDSARLYDNVPD